MIKEHKNYQRFISDDFENVKDQFAEIGYYIEEEDDFCTYQGWKEKGRKVKRGEKGLKVTSSLAYSQPVFYYGTPVYDKETGKQKFARYPKSFVLFHITQTEDLKV